MAENNVETFWGIEVWDVLTANNPYFTEVKVKQGLQANFHAVVNEPINQKYPTVIYPSKTDYLSGSASGSFSDNQSKECDTDYTNTQFKLTFSEWLRNRYTKYLKLSDTLVIPIAVTAVTYDIEASIDDNFDTTVSFEWVQVGKALMSTDILVKCPVCYSALVPNAHYCHMCGTPIEQNRNVLEKGDDID